MSAAALKARWLEGYAADLLADPPVRSVASGPEGEPDPAKRQRNARRLASKDVERTLRVFSGVGLEVGDAGRIADLKACLADWLADYDAGRLNGGNPTGTDYDELEARTRRLLLPAEQQPIEGVGLFAETTS